MKKLLATGAVAAVVCALAVLGAVAPAGAQSTGGRSFTVTVDHRVLNSGDHLTASATANATCTWLLEWNRERRSAQVRAFSATFTAPSVTRPTRIVLHATCFYTVTPPARPRARPGPAPARSSDVQALVVRVPPSWRHDVSVTVLPAGATVSPPHGNPGGVGGLPATGGPSFWLLVDGALAVVLGALAVRASGRRRYELTLD